MAFASAPNSAKCPSMLSMGRNSASGMNRHSAWQSAGGKNMSVEIGMTKVLALMRCTRLWPFLSRQRGERFLTIDDLCERSHYRRRTAHAAPARSYLTRLSPFCATLFPAGLGPRANLALGRASGTWGSYCDGGLADHGVGPGAAVHDLPPGPQPGHLVSAPGQSDSARAAPHGPGAPRGHDRLRGRRHGRTPVRAEDQRERLLPGCGALHQKARYPLLWLEVGVHDALGASALEPAGVGVALFDSTLLAQAKAPHTTA